MSERGGGGGRNRRLSPRFSAVLACEIRLPEGEQGSNLLFPGETILARTRDVSASGLGVVAPAIYLGYDCIVDQGRTLQVTLRLPPGAVTMKATAVHYVRQDRGGEETSYLIGLRIEEMSAAEAALYMDYLGVLSRAGV